MNTHKLQDIINMIRGLDKLPTDPYGQRLSVDELMDWFQATLKKLTPDYHIHIIAISTHGATCAMLDEQGELVHPVISYTAPCGAKIQEAFYDTFGDRRSLHKETSTADFGFANVAKHLFLVKTGMPDLWAQVRHAMFYDTYLGYRLTGTMATESTYLGNHTYLWRYKQGEWSSVAKALGADKLFPSKVLNPWDSLGAVKREIAEACGLPADCRVTCGIHDSNANFLVYLAKGYQDFILNSTGTWCVAMKPHSVPELSEKEMDQKLFFNMDATGQPVVTALFPGGMEYDKFRGFSTHADESDAPSVGEVASKRELFVVPGVLLDAQVFPGAAPKVVHGDDSYSLDDLEAGRAPIDALGQAYFAALNLGLAIGSKEMMGRLGAGAGTTIIIEGGFAGNAAYCKSLATLLPDCTIALTNMKEGTSFGAALTGWMLAEALSIEAIGREFHVEITPIPAGVEADLDAYEQAWRAKL